jgi:hypothetical protein
MCNPQATKGQAMRTDVYQKITDQIVSELEKGVRPWMKPWNAEHAAGRITRPLRGNGIPYQGINILMLWSAAMEKGFAAPIWMTFKQALEFKAHVRKGEQGSLINCGPTFFNVPDRVVHGPNSVRSIRQESCAMMGQTDGITLASDDIANDLGPLSMGDAECARQVGYDNNESNFGRHRSCDWNDGLRLRGTH